MSGPYIMYHYRERLGRVYWEWTREVVIIHGQLARKGTVEKVGLGT